MQREVVGGSSGVATYSSWVANDIRTGGLSDAGGLSELDIKSLQYYCTLQVLVIGGKLCELFWVGTVLDSRSGITCMPEKLAWRLEAHFSDERLAYSFPVSYSYAWLTAGRWR